jgi:hypothetical protein
MCRSVISSCIYLILSLTYSDSLPSGAASLWIPSLFDCQTSIQDCKIFSAHYLSLHTPPAMTDVAVAPAPAPMATSPVQGPPILSFPAILRNPGLSNRFAHLQGDSQERAAARRAQNAVTPAKKRQRDQNDGKRWVRRKDNGL